MAKKECGCTRPCKCGTVPRMNDEERNDVCAKLEWEGGLEYLIRGSNFDEVKDKHFHSLRKAFVFAAKQLEDYLRYDEYLDECIGDPQDEGSDED